MNKTKRVYIKTVIALMLVSLLFIDNLSSETAVVATTSSAPNATQPMNATATPTDGLTANNATNAIGSAISEIVNDTLQNTTSALENATAALTNATKALQDISDLPTAAAPGPPTPPTTTITTASPVNSTTVINSIFENNLPAIFIIVISAIIGV